MASLAISGTVFRFSPRLLRSSFSRPRQIGINRQIRTSPAMSKEQIEELQKNPYFEKYAGKIAQLQKTSPEEFVSRVNASDEQRKVRKAAEEGQEFSFPTKPKSTTSGMVKEKKLCDVMKLELLEGKSSDEIGDIWRTFYSGKDALSAVIPGDTYRQMATSLRQFSTFLFPLPRKNGYEFILMQFSGNVAHFTTLINYQAYKENAPECLSLVHYTELLEDKNLVLMVGEYDKNMLNIQEALCLANQLEMFYFNPTPDRRKLVETFTRQPDQFKHMDLVQQLESISLISPEKTDAQRN